MNTQKEIAEELGVSISTVSYVFNNKWRQKGITKSLADKVNAKLKEVNYLPSMLGRQLKTKKTHTVGIILGDLTRVFNLEILTGAERVLASSNYDTIVCNSNNGMFEKRQIENLLARNVEGIILLSVSRNNKNNSGTIYEIIKENVPLVLVDIYRPEIKTNFVVSDNFWGAYQASKYLIAKGCQKIVYLGEETTRDVTAEKERFDGYISALSEGGIEAREDLVFRKVTEHRNFYQVMGKVFSGEKPDGLFIESFLYFKDGFRFLAERGLRVPDDVSITGFDPIDLTLNEMQKINFHAVIKKPIPFMKQKGWEMGEKAAKIILDMIEGKKKKVSRIFLKPEFKQYD